MKPRFGFLLALTGLIPICAGCATRPGWRPLAPFPPLPPDAAEVAVPGKQEFAPEWKTGGAYLKRMIDDVQVRWENILVAQRTYPPPNTSVTVTFVLDANGKVSRIDKVDEKSTKVAVDACLTAITARPSYGPWSEKMITALGQEQTLTFTFYYQ